MEEKSLNWNPESRPGYLVNRASRLFIRASEIRLRELGIGSGPLPVFGALRGGKALPQKELARLAHIEQPTMAQTLARMERDGIIERRPDPTDKRSSLVSLTPSAEAKIPHIFSALQEGNEEALAGLSPDERETFVHLLRRIIGNLEGMVAKEGRE